MNSSFSSAVKSGFHRARLFGAASVSSRTFTASSAQHGPVRALVFGFLGQIAQLVMACISDPVLAVPQSNLRNLIGGELRESQATDWIDVTNPVRFRVDMSCHVAFGP